MGEDPAFHSHGGSPSPAECPHSPSGWPGPLTFFEHSVSLLSPLAGPDLPWSAQRAMFSLPCLSLWEGRRATAEGREESSIVLQPSWDVWTQADSQCQRENTPPSHPRDGWIMKIGPLPTLPASPTTPDPGTFSVSWPWPRSQGLCVFLHAHRHMHTQAGAHTALARQV